MPLYKFKEGDVFRNRIKAHPKSSFLLTSGSVFYNSDFFEIRTIDSGETNYLNHIAKGHISLYEMNVDRPSGQLIYPFITKQGNLNGFRTISTKSFQTSGYGDDLSPSDAKYPMSSSIAFDYVATSTPPRIKSLKNTLNHYKPLSRHYSYSSTFGNKSSQDLTLISIPSIFYGSSI